MQPNIYYATDHGIDESWIDPDARYVLNKLSEAGFTAYLVGGGVRDLLLRKAPKDFDISTSARPEQIKALFQRQCILIGRRFRLAHIRFGRKVIEVATFRTGENASDLIVTDNEWGSPEEDVLRRDFTVNGLFYDPLKHAVIDYVGGWEDIRTNTLRTIGIAPTRFQQDPVRILRLLKFRARYNFHIDTDTNDAAQQCRQEIVKSSPARILEELMRMLESGAASPFLKLLLDYEILPILFPTLSNVLRKPQGKLVFHYLTCADHWRLHKGHIILERAILTACLLYPILEHEIKHKFLNRQHTPHLGDITQTASSLIRELLIHPFPHFPRRLAAETASILVAQYRLTPVGTKRQHREKLFHHKDFEFSLKFLKLRALVDEKLVETYTSIKQQYQQFLHQGERPHHAPPVKRPSNHWRRRRSDSHT